MERATAAAVVMVRPAAFGANAETAGSNEFQGAASDAASLRARGEFDALAAKLVTAGAAVTVLEDTPQPPKPDAVFPNNWFSTHADGTLVLYPMLASNRRIERRASDLCERLRADGYSVRRTVDLSYLEAQNAFVEGTGSLVLDRPRRIAYACYSARTTPNALAEFARQLDYEVLAFDASSPRGMPIYHTNVMMALGESLAILCSAAIAHSDERRAVEQSLTAGGREILHILPEQMLEFAGNALFLRGRGQSLVTISARAWRSLGDRQQSLLAQHAKVLTGDIDTIEAVGGGSVRCMLAENFLPRQA